MGDVGIGTQAECIPQIFSLREAAFSAESKEARFVLIDVKNIWTAEWALNWNLFPQQRILLWFFRINWAAINQRRTNQATRRIWPPSTTAHESAVDIKQQGGAIELLFLPIEWPTNATVNKHALDLSLYIGCDDVSIRSNELKWDCDSISDGIKGTSRWIFGTVFVWTPPTVCSRFHQTQSISRTSLVVSTVQSSILVHQLVVQVRFRFLWCFFFGWNRISF